MFVDIMRFSQPKKWFKTILVLETKVCSKVIALTRIPQDSLPQTNFRVPVQYHCTILSNGFTHYATRPT